MSSPTLPTVNPTPLVKESTVGVGPRPATRPRTAEPRMRARNGCTLSQVISTTTVAMPSSAARMSTALLLEAAAASVIGPPLGLGSPDGRAGAG
jgi:hypothetical protein